MNGANLEPDARWRVSPAWRRTAIAAFVVLVPLGLHALWDYIEIRRLVREIEAPTVIFLARERTR